MSSLQPFKLSTCAILTIGLVACATTQTATSDTSAQAIGQTNANSTLPKPTPEMIAAIANASPLERAAFWLEQYHLHPTDLDISLAHINALTEIKSYDKAAEIAKFTSISFPENADVMMILGKAYVRNEKPVDAMRAYSRAVDLAPDNPKPLAAMGVIFDKRGDHENAQVAYKRALALEPNRASTLANLGLSLSLSGKLDEAEAALGKAANLPDATPAIRQNHALILGLMGRFKEAQAVAAVDAPDGIAEQNAKFLQNLTGKTPELTPISQSKTTPSPAPAITQQTEIPAAAPARWVNTQGLESLPENLLKDLPEKSAVEEAPKQIANADIHSTGTQAPASTGLRLRKRQREHISGGQD